MKPKLITKSQEITKLDDGSYEIRFVVTIDASKLNHAIGFSEAADALIAKRVSEIKPGTYSAASLRAVFRAGNSVYASRKIDRAVELGLLSRTDDPKRFIKR